MKVGSGMENECTTIDNFLMTEEYSVYSYVSSGNIVDALPGKQVINNAQEIIIPKVQAWWQNQNVSSHLLNTITI